MGYLFTTSRMIVIKKTGNSVGEDAETLKPSYIAVGDIILFNCLGNQFGSSSKCYHEVTI